MCGAARILARPALLHALWDTASNQRKHLLGTKIEVNGSFIQNGKYHLRDGRWELVRRETALPRSPGQKSVGQERCRQVAEIIDSTTESPAAGCADV